MNTKLLLYCFLLSIFSLTYPMSKEKFYDWVADQNCPTLSNEDNQHRQKPKPPQTLSQAATYELHEQMNLLPSEKRRRAFKLLADAFPYQGEVLDEFTCKDLELISADAPGRPFASSIDKTKTELGKALLYSKLLMPTTDIGQLRINQSIIRYIRGQGDFSPCSFLTQLSSLLQKLAENENCMFSFFPGPDIFEEQLKTVQLLREEFKSKVFRSLAQWANTNPNLIDIANTRQALSAVENKGREKLSEAFAVGLRDVKALWTYIFHVISTTVTKCCDDLKVQTGLDSTVFSGIGCSIMPLIEAMGIDKINTEELRLIMQDLPGLLKPVTQAVSGFVNSMPYFFNPSPLLFIADTIMADAEPLDFSLDLIRCLRKKIIKVHEYLKTTLAIRQLVDTHVPSLAKSMPLLNSLSSSTDISLQDLVQKLSCYVEKPFNPLAPGETQVTYALICKHKNTILGYMRALAELDVYASLACYVSEFNGVAYPVYCGFESPFISLEDFWAPLVGAGSVKNKIVIGDASDDRAGLIITGQNKGGKSTTMRNILYSIILAQTFGIAAARSCLLKPFSKIATCFYVPDKQTKETQVGVPQMGGISSHEAQCKRLATLFDIAKNSSGQHVSLIAFNEPFTGTNSIESAGLTMDSLQWLNNLQYAASLVTTHFIEHLKKEVADLENFKCYKMDGKNHYNQPKYILEEGISGDFCGIEVAKNEGIPTEIVEKAAARVAPYIHACRIQQPASQARTPLNVYEIREKWAGFYQKFLISIDESLQPELLRDVDAIDPRSLSIIQQFYHNNVVWRSYLIYWFYRHGNNYLELVKRINRRIETGEITLSNIIEFFLADFNVAEVKTDIESWQWFYKQCKNVADRQIEFFNRQDILFIVTTDFDEFLPEMALDFIAHILAINPTSLNFKSSGLKFQTFSGSSYRAGNCLHNAVLLKSPYNYEVARLLTGKAVSYYGRADFLINSVNENGETPFDIIKRRGLDSPAWLKLFNC